MALISRSLAHATLHGACDSTLKITGRMTSSVTDVYLAE